MNGSTRSYEMAKRLVNAGHEVHIFTSRRGNEHISKGWYIEYIDGITVHWVHVSYDNSFGFFRRMLAFGLFAMRTTFRCTKEGGDVIFATSTPLTISIPAIFAKRRLRIPMVFEVRDLWPELPIAVGALKSRPLIFLAQQLEKWTYRNSDFLIGLSPGMCEGIKKHGIVESIVHCIPNSCDIELFQVDSNSENRFRDKYKWLQNRPLVVYAGTIGTLNGVTYLADVAEKMSVINPAVVFAVVGEGVGKDELIQNAKSKGILEKNFFVLPAISKSEMPGLYSAATFITSLFIPLEEMWANSANKFFDGLAAGKPVAINYDGWQADLIREHGNGLVLDPSDANQSALALNEAIEDAARLREMGAISLSVAKSEFARDDMAVKLQQVFERAAMVP